MIVLLRMEELISVIIPVYNTGPYLERCLNSVLRQDHPFLEILLVDDGSSDALTIQLCDKLASENENVMTYHKKNGGSASARNFGIQYAHGDYIGFVDSDDVIEPNMYSSLFSDIQSHNVKIAIGNIATEENGRLIDSLESLPSGEYNNTELLHFFFLGHWHSACTNLYEKSLFDVALFPEGEVNEDFMLNYWLFKEQEKVYYNSTAFYHYVRREGSNTASPVTMAFLDWIKHTALICKDLSGRDDLAEEKEYQYLYSNIILGNKCLLTLKKAYSKDANQLYGIVTSNLKKERKRVLKNAYLSVKNRLFGILLSYVPSLYKAITIPILHVIK